MHARNYDDWTIDRWRIEPRVRGVEFDVADPDERTPPLWQDLALASVMALMLWMVAVAVFP